MARIDKLKEEIGWLKIIFAILIATGISLCAWVVQNYGKISKILLIVSVIGIFLLTFVIVWINQVAYRKIDELEEL
jgi:4-hydroxybenzoate polyprenyltransferase